MYTKENHRKRVRDRFRTEGLDNFDPVHALELLLFYAIPQKDTKPLARELLNRYETFHGVLEAPMDDLLEMHGVSENIATFLKLALEIGRYYDTSRTRDIKILRNSTEYGEYLMGQFKGRSNERLYMLCLDAKCKLLCCKLLGEGDVVSINLPFRRVVEIALNVKATTVVLAHNHPSGVAIPSQEDVAVTMQLRQALKTMGIDLADHIIVADGEYVSMAQSKCWL